MKLQRPDPGIDAAKSGLHGKAGIFFSAGLLEKGEPRFDLQDLDPYLLFDSRESMIGTLENPTLDLNPAAPSTLDVITATRAGVATFTEPDGTIASASPNTVRVDYTQGAELTPTVYQLVGNTNFSGWVVQGNTTLTSNTTETLSPDGTNNATKMTSNGSEGLYIAFLGTASLNTKSIFLKGVSGGEQVILQDPHQNIDPLTCTLTTEWQRFHLTQTQTGSFGLWLTNIPSGGIYAYGPQVQVLGLTDFVENTTGSPKFITGPTFGPRVPMILVEPSATNLVTYSEDFSHSSWTKTAATMEGGHTAPDGTETAYKLIEDNTNSVHRTFQTATASVSPSASISVFVKYSGRRYVLIRFADQSVGRWYDLISGTLGGTYLGTPNDSSIELIGNDWYRITLSHTSDAQARCEFWVSDTESVNSYTGDGTSGVYIWGAQLETGIATSYIPTSGSTAQRAADDLVISGSDFDFYNQSEGTIYAETIISPSSQPSGDYLWSINDGGYTNRIVSVYDAVLYHYVISSNAINFVSSTAVSSLDEIMRTALSYKTNNALHSVNGVTSTPDTSVTLPSGLNKLNLGQDNASGNTMTGRIKRLIYWPYHSDSL